MIALIIRRIFQSIIVMLTVALVAFTLFRYVGDPITQMVGQETSIADMDRLRQELGLNDPVIVQFARFAWNTLQGEFGISYRLGRPVNELFVERLPATLELSLVAALFSLIIGIPMGVYTGLYPDRILSKVFQAVSLIGIALPTFLIGILLILFFGVLLGWADFWPRRGGPTRLVVDRTVDRKRFESPYYAGFYPGYVPVDLDHAIGPL